MEYETEEEGSQENRLEVRMEDDSESERRRLRRERKRQRREERKRRKEMKEAEREGKLKQVTIEEDENNNEEKTETGVEKKKKEKRMKRKERGKRLKDLEEQLASENETMKKSKTEVDRENEERGVVDEDDISDNATNYEIETKEGEVNEEEISDLAHNDNETEASVEERDDDVMVEMSDDEGTDREMVDENAPCVTSIDEQLEERELIERELKEQEEGRITLDVGCRHFATSRKILLKDKNSIFNVLLEEGKKHYFIDRDGAHFRLILNYLRQDCSTMLAALPRENKYLIELRNECIFYNLTGLRRLCENRLALYRSLGLAY